MKKTKMLSPLSRDISRKLRQLGMTNRDFADVIGHSLSNATSLINGNRPWTGADIETTKKVARFLGVPRATVLMLAGIIQPEDFMVSDSLDDSLDQAYTQIRNDHIYGGFVTEVEEWRAMPSKVRILISLLYERAQNVELLKKAQMIEVAEA